MTGNADPSAVVHALAELSSALEDPHIAARTAAYLAGDLPGLEDPMTRNDVQIVLRLPQVIRDRADALIPLLESRQEIAALGKVTRSKVIRLALVKGLDALEREGSA